MALNRHTLDRETAHRTLGVLLEYQDDLERMAEGGVDEVTGSGVKGARRRHAGYWSFRRLAFSL